MKNMFKVWMILILVLGLLTGCSEPEKPADEPIPPAADANGEEPGGEEAEPTVETVTDDSRRDRQELLNADGYVLRATESVYDAEDRLVEEITEFYEGYYASRPEFPNYAAPTEYVNRCLWRKQKLYGEEGYVQEEIVTVFAEDGTESYVARKTFDPEGNITDTVSEQNTNRFFCCDMEEITKYLQELAIGEQIIENLASSSREVELTVLDAWDWSESSGYPDVYLHVYEYEENGNVTWHDWSVKVENELSYMGETQAYNEVGQLTYERHDRDRPEYDDQVFIETYYSYNSEGKLAETAHTSKHPTSCSVDRTQHLYDDQGNMIMTIELSEQDNFDNGNVFYSSNHANVHYYEYNEKGWLVSEYEFGIPVERPDDLFAVAMESVIPLLTEDDLMYMKEHEYDENGVRTKYIYDNEEYSCDENGERIF